VIRLFGIRHHGPGSARAVRDQLHRWQPDIVLVELPADCAPAVRWIGDTGLRPPVALLGWVLDQPRRAVFLPLAEFSPEWQAMRWAAESDVPVRPIDLPLSRMLATSPDDDALALHPHRPSDPLAALAAAAGDVDPERWWEDVIEHRSAPCDDADADEADPFQAVAEAMHAVRGGSDPSTTTEARREAHMRQALRRARADGFQRIAVVCGAWHVPALAEPFPAAKLDAATLRGLPTAKIGVSWVPWTYQRMAAASGYGAGVESPAWYAHVFGAAQEDRVSRWFVDAARLLRDRGTLVSPDHLIGAVRAADALAALRGRPHPGLGELLDASSAVLADQGGMALIRNELVVGSTIGQVPASAPQVPLARDLGIQQRAVRLAVAAEPRTIELDVRTASGRRRSVLLHRLRALGVSWGEVIDGRGSSGTFRETWRLVWEPELAVRVVELAGYGTTVADAATARLVEAADGASSLSDVVAVLDVALLGDLDRAVQPAVARLAHLAAGDHDVGELIDALPALAQTLRYGDVRGTDSAALRATFDGIVVRVLAGLLDACRARDAEMAAAMAERLSAVHAALALCDHPARFDRWPRAVAEIGERGDVSGVIRGRAARLLHDSGWWDGDELQRRMSRSLSPGTDASTGASFVEGFLAGSGTVLVHDRVLLAVLDDWVAGLAAGSFDDAMPLLRRTFGGFDLAERRQLGLLVAGHGRDVPPGDGFGVDPERAAAALATVRLMLGLPS
jgi:hypothetical protein